MPQPTFCDHYSETDFSAFCDAALLRKTSPNNKQATDAWFEHLRHFDDALLQFIKAKSARGSLPEVPFAKGRGHAWADAWNALARQDFDPSSNDHIMDNLCSGMGLHYLTARATAPSSADFLPTFRSICEDIDSGQLPAPRNSESQCQITATPLDIDFRDGGPLLFSFEKDAAGKRVQRFIHRDEEPLGMQHVRVFCPSGDLILCDWPRIEEFTRAASLIDGSTPEPITFSARAARSQRYAEELGFLSVSVGNSMPHVLLDSDGTLSIAKASEPSRAKKPSRRQDLGAIDTQLWQATLIDLQTLLDIVERAKPGQGSAIVGDYLKTHSTDIIRTRIAPETELHAYFLDDGIDGFQSQSFNSKGLAHLFCVISPTEMTWTPNAPNARAARSNKP